MPVPDCLNQRTQRPFGISILSVLHFLGGIGLCVVAAWGASMLKEPRVAKGIAEMGIPLPLIAAGIGLLVFLGIGSGIGMWKGAKWGWYLGSFYYAYSIMRNLNALYSLSAVNELFASTPEEADSVPGHGLSYYYIKYGVRALISIMIYAYFFNRNVRAFFGLGQAKKWPAIAAQMAICIAFLILFSAWFLYS